MYVYVINKHGQPIMPCRPRKARVLLQEGKATVVKQVPFTIRLLYGSSGYKQSISLGMDAGSRHIGIAATAAKKVLYAEELKPRNDVVRLLSVRRENRRARRNRKTRHRESRFDNRVHSKHKGWLAPSVEVKIQEHISAVLRMQKMLPISEIHAETAEFDMQRLKAMTEGKTVPVGTDYHKGEMYDQYNVRQYVLFRDGYKCKCCGKHGDGVKLHVHHKESRQTGGNAPNNLITLCEDCHKAIHAGTMQLPDDKAKRGKTYKDAAFMGIMRKAMISQLRELVDIPVTETYGYITKYYRELYHVEKSHINDAVMISNNFKSVADDTYYVSEAVRHHNRQLHKNTILKGGVRKRNQAQHVVKGFRLFDLVKYEGDYYYVFGRRSNGFMDTRTLDGKKINKGSISNKRLNFVSTSKGLLVERKKAIPLADKPAVSLPDISMKKYLVFDWGGTEIKYAVMNEEGEILDHNAVPSPLKEDTRDIFISMLDDVVSLYKEDIDGIAISSPGIIDAEKGMIEGVSTFPYMNGFDVRTLEERYHAPVTIENDARCAAMAELWNGSLKDVQNGAVLIAGTHLGGAFILDGKLYRGMHNSAGEYSSVCIGKDMYADSLGTPMLCKKVSESLHLDHVCDGKEAFTYINEGKGLEALHAYTDSLATFLFDINILLDLDKISIGGGISVQESFIESLKESVNKITASHPDVKQGVKLPVPVIDVCRYHNESNMIGALYWHLH